jgi:rod shape-determining protein MreC
MWELLRKKRTLLFAAVALVAALILYSYNLKSRERANAFERVVLTLTAPFMGVIAEVDRFFLSIWNDYIALVSVRKENLALRETVKGLNNRIIQGQDALFENERLKKLLALQSTIKLATVAANVIGEESAPWYRSIIIDRGSVEGLADGMPVVATSGVVGRVVKVAANSARVLLLTDHASSISALIQRSRARGVLKGKGGSSCSLEFTVREDDVKVGDIVTTSGIGGVFQKGIPLGEVTMVRKGEYGMFQTIDVRPAVNTYHLEEVLVVLQRSEP